MPLTFQKLFVGNEHAYGEWNPQRPEPAQTKRAQVAASAYAAHLAGKVGLGLVPVRSDGSCRFAALDIDIDTINHQDLYNKLTARKIPGAVCRSKSGGAHVYFFFNEPGMAAGTVRSLLKKYAGLLGYHDCEIFPKQVKTGSKNFGNWINLPYFGGDDTTRYAIGPEGSLNLEQFLGSVVFVTGKEKLDEASVIIDEKLVSTMPPCLESLTKQGIPEGQRNNALFNFGVFYRKSAPNGWEDLLVKHNTDYCRPPMSNKEIQSVVRSVSRTKYQYLCDREPICSYCDRKRCVTLPYGVNHMPWKESGSYDELLVSNCRKLLTDPPRYIVEVNGQDVEFGTEELITFSVFRRRIIEVLDAVVQPMKQEAWEREIRDLLSAKMDIAAPADASRRGMILSRVNSWLAIHDRSRSRDDLARGLPYLEDDKVMFRVRDLIKALNHDKTEIKENELYQILHSVGCEYLTMKIKGKSVVLWSMPISSVDVQTEDFDAPDFGEKREDNL